MGIIYTHVYGAPFIPKDAPTSTRESREQVLLWKLADESGGGVISLKNEKAVGLPGITTRYVSARTVSW